MMKSFIYLLTQVSGIAASCYDNWFDLMADVEDAEADQEFVVCPGTDLIPEAIVSGEEVFTDIWIYQSGTRLLCGENGESNNMCKFKGGQSHLYISDDDIEGVFVSGFLFEGANETSVIAYGTSISSATFVDCHWNNNSGIEGGAVNVWHTYDTRGKAQSVTFEKCSFTNNNADDGTVLVEGGKLTLKESLFSNNKGGWAVELKLNSKAEIYNTCFSHNAGPVYIYSGSDVLASENNHGQNNNGDKYDCEGSWDEKRDSCEVFTASKCQPGPKPGPTTIFITLIVVIILLLVALVWKKKEYLINRYRH